MAITAISRDILTQTINIVRMTTDNTIDQVLRSGFLSNSFTVAQLTALNNGVWTWLPNDVVLVQATDGNALLSISSDLTHLFPFPGVQTSTDEITAFSGGGQTNATPLITQINRVTTVAASGDSVLLPLAYAGTFVTVINAAASNAMNVFPQTGQSINALSANTAFSMAANKTATFYCASGGIWNSILTA